jgi:hypothetical protein
VPISPENFDQLKSAKESLLETMFIEEKFNLILENYAEFELELLNHSLRRILFHDFDWLTTVDKMHSINRKIINLLTTCRLYIDQVKHNINKIYGSDSQQTQILKSQLSHEYDSVFGYQVMEAMRNYVQHRNLPINQISTNMRWIEIEDKRFCKHTVKLNINVEDISKDKKFKASVLSKLQEQGSLVEFIPLMRQYLESIGRVHLKIREILKSDLARWESEIYQAITLCKKSPDDEIFYISASASPDDSNTSVETVEIFDDFIKRRQTFERKNNIPITLCIMLVVKLQK